MGGVDNGVVTSRPAGTRAVAVGGDMVRGAAFVAGWVLRVKEHREGGERCKWGGRSTSGQTVM